MLLYCAVASLINAVTAATLGFLVFSRDHRNAKNITYFLFALSVVLWSMAYFFWLTSNNPTQALFYSRLFVAGLTFLPVFYLHHILVLLRLVNSKRGLLFFAYGFAIFSLILDVTPYMVAGVVAKGAFPFWPEPGILFHPFLLIWIGICVYTAWLIFGQLKKLMGLIRGQARYILFGTLLGYAGGITNFFLWYDIPIPPFGNIMTSVQIAITAYAVIRLRLMDMRIIARNILVFTGLLTFVYASFLLATFFVREVLSVYFGSSHLWAYAFSIFLIILGYDPIRKTLMQATDRFLLHTKYDYQKVLKDASRGISKIESLEHLLWLVIHFITMKMRVANAAVLTRQGENNNYELGYQRGYPKNYLAYTVEKTHPLIVYLTEGKQAVEIEKIKDLIQSHVEKKNRRSAFTKEDFNIIYETMQELDATCCVPSFLGRELRNVLILGQKKSGEPYTDQDLNVLYTLAQESAIAIENARLFDEAVHKSKELERINEQLEYSKELLMKALKDTEVANKQLQDTQVQLIHEQKMATLGRLAASVGHEVNNPLTILSMNVSRAVLKSRKNPDLKVNEILELFQKMEQNIGRIKAVVNTLTGLLKRTEKGKFEPLSLKLILEETLPLVQFQTYLDNLTGTEVAFEVPGNIPLIRGDLERLQEVFLNLFINAYHAMTGRRHRRIHVRAEVDSKNPHVVTIHFTDNGCGMTEEVIRRIFNYGYTTKPAGKGSGMGLYMCKYIIELHGGSVNVESRVGEGTTFTLTLPIYEEETSGSDVKIAPRQS